MVLRGFSMSCLVGLVCFLVVSVVLLCEFSMRCFGDLVYGASSWVQIVVFGEFSM